MPEFILDHGSAKGSRDFNALDSFTQGYVEAMFFTDTGNEENEELEHVTFSDLTESALEKIKADCVRFKEANIEDFAHMDATHEQAGRDFWYTRNGHGTGFWDRDEKYYPKDMRDRLDVSARTFGEVYSHDYF